jgi:NAD(P)H-hydrate epimerase
MNAAAIVQPAVGLQSDQALAFTTALLDARQMAEADRLTVAGGVSVSRLMQNAGKGVAQEIMRRWSARPVTVLCGPGNNGGDAFVAARALAEAGWSVRVALLGAREGLKGAAREHADLWHGAIEALAPAVIEGAQLIVDGLFGAGLSRALAGAARETLAAAAAARIPIVAVDIPSGVQGDSGENLGAVASVLTVTCFRKKPGHLLLPGRTLCGELVVTDIGTPAEVLQQILPNAFENDPALWLSALPQLHADGNKYSRGSALIAGGYPLTGAARMAARAAARIGAGLVTIAVPEVALPIYAGALTSIMVKPLAAPTDFDALTHDRRITGFLIGPGAGVGEQTRARTLALLATGRATLIDADAISSFREDSEALMHAIRGPCVLTPHAGEFKRIFDPSGDKLSRTRRAAARSGAVIVLKGTDTVIAAPDGRAIVNANAPPTLATAGTGDVLSGMVLGLLTQGMDHFLAAAAAVWLHGAAASDFGPGLMAEDLPDLLPSVLRRLNPMARRSVG